VVPVNKTGLRNTLKLAGISLAVVLTIFSVITFAVSLALGPVLFFSTEDGLKVAARQLAGIPLDIFMAITVPIPVTVTIGSLFVGIWIIFVACFAIAFMGRGGLIHSVRSSFKDSISVSKSNFLVVMSLLAPALLYSTIFIQKFQEAEGVQTGNLAFPPQTSPYVILINLAFAPIREEFAFRITSIGIPLGIFLIFAMRTHVKHASWGTVKLFLISIISPEFAKARAGRRTVASDGLIRGISPLEWILILITSIAFGSAHYLLGGGWEVGKISTAFLAGFAFALMYVAYSAYAPLLLHWYFNYFFTIFDMAESTYGTGFGTASNLILAVNFFAGQVVVLIFLLYLAYKLGKALADKVLHIGKTA